VRLWGRLWQPAVCDRHVKQLKKTMVSKAAELPVLHPP